MPCYHPLQGYRSLVTTKNGKRKIVFSPSAGYVDLPVEVPCGQCIGCRLERSRQWAIRLMHEAQGHEQKCFVTLTYDDKKLPVGGTLNKKHFQDFVKRLRRRTNGGIRYFHCGEYGDNSFRPHYHAILFGVDFPDRKFHTRNGQGDELHKSEALETLWGHGNCLVGNVSFETAAYVARYIVGKITGEQQDSYYRVTDPETGEVHQLEPPYVTMSLKPGIGAAWFEKYKSDVYPDDFLVYRGQRQGSTRFYDTLYSKVDLKAATRLKYSRRRRAHKRKEDNTPERLAVKETIRLSKLTQLKRTL